MGSKKEKDLFELFYRDRVKYTWKNLGEHAQGMYDTPQDAIDILAKYSSLLRKAAPGTYPIYDLITSEIAKKKNKGKKVNRIISENLEQCCKLMGIDYSKVGYPKSKVRKNPKLAKLDKTKPLDRQLIIDRVVMRLNRAKKNPKEFKKYQKENSKFKKLVKLHLRK